MKHFPYGEEPTTTNQNRVKFATYYRDSTTALDYAQQRYYARTIGRFTSPDPYVASGGPADPQSWNRYSYVQNDPVNFNDPEGLFKRVPDEKLGYCEINPTDPKCQTPLMYNAWVRGNAPPYLVALDSRRDDGASLEEEWNALSEPCQRGLETAMGQGRGSWGAATSRRLVALHRALAAKDTLITATAKYYPTAISWQLLAAMGIRESQARADAVQPNVKGKKKWGRGFFQIDLEQQGWTVTEDQAMNLSWAADFAAHSLTSNYFALMFGHPGFDMAHLLQATAASWNLGTSKKAITGNPDTIDVGSQPDGKYGSNVMDLMGCFD